MTTSISIPRNRNSSAVLAVKEERNVKSPQNQGKQDLIIFSIAGLLALATIVAPVALSASEQQKKPNILVIMADDVGYWNIFVAQWLSSFKEYPPRQKPGTFSLDQVQPR
jgi:hypothetical protein